MRKIIFSGLALTLMAGSFSCQNNIDIEKEKEAIKAVIENESNSAHNKNFDQQSKSFLQDESLISISRGKNSISFSEGWERISGSYKQIMAFFPEPSPNTYQFTDYQIKIHDEIAWAVYIEAVYNIDDELLTKYINTRILEKVDGEWKIAYLSYVDTSL